MIKRTTFISLIVLILLPLNVEGQRWKLRRYEGGIGLATSHFFGDIGGTADDSNLMGFKDIQLEYTRPSISLDLRYKLTGDMAAKFSMVYGYVTGDDAGSRNDARNFSFTSTIFEPSLQFEYYLLPEGRSYSSAALFNRRGMINNYSKVYVYVFGGIGGVFYNVTPSEGFEERYIDNFSKFGASFPVGGGLKFSIDATWSMGFELGRRFTTTDYIDGYTSDFSEYNDTYYFGIVKAIYKVRTDRRGRPMFNRGFYRRR